MATQAQLVSRVLGLLRVIGAGQPASAEDSQIVTDYIPEKLDDLAQRAVIYIADPDDIPTGALQWLAIVISQDLAEDYGVAIDGGKIAFAESRLRELQSDDAAGPVRATYY